MLRMFTLCLLIAAAPGCVTRPVLHESWARPAMVGEGECPVIDGEYENAGDRSVPILLLADHPITSSSLAHLLNGLSFSIWYEADDRLGKTWQDPALDPIRAIRVTRLGDRLRFEGFGANGYRRSFELPVQASCKGSMVRTIEWTSDTLDGPYPVDARSGLAFGRLADGSLLVQEISKLPTPGFGYKLVLFSDYYNYRFAAITPATVQAKPAD